MTPRRFVALLVASVVTVACTRGSDGRRDPPSTSTATSAPTSAAAEAAPGSNSTHASANDDAGAAASPLTTARSIGNTSVVFKLTFESGAKAAYKPRCKRGRERYKAEIAAYRLARALGIRNVPEAGFRKLALSDLERALGAHGPSLAMAKKELVADAEGNVAGAYIPWLAGLEFVRLEDEPWRSKWRGWVLTSESVPEADRATAAQVASMIVFDSITGNWDRWSGANVGWNGGTRELLFVDNDGAFMVPSPAPFERQRELLRMLKKYPRALVVRLRELDESTLRQAFGEETPGVALLSAGATRDTDARRRAVLEQVDARVRELGDARVFAFE